MNTALERSYANAERVTASWARSFYFASRFVPLAKRRSIFALYDYCRHADNLVDLRGSRPVAEVRQQLAELGATPSRWRPSSNCSTAWPPISIQWKCGPLPTSSATPIRWPV